MRIDPVRCLFGPRALRGWALLWLLAGLCLALPVRAQGLEVLELRAAREDGGVLLDVHVQLTLSNAVDDALRRGIPIYFQAQATLYRPRWYWRDERLARATKTWRLSYQPLTASWRVSQGGLHQNYATQEEALAVISRLARWKITDGERVAVDERCYVEFSYQLDTTQLPRPMQIGIGGQADWALGHEQTLRLE